MTRRSLGRIIYGLLLCSLSFPAFSADNLRLNQKLDFSSDSQDGPLISGDHMRDGLAAGKPNYIIMFQEGCFNSKHQAQRTVELYERYKQRVHFVIVDLDRNPPAEQQELVRKYYRNYIPQVTVLDASGNALYNQAGEVEVSRISALLDRALAP